MSVPTNKLAEKLAQVRQRPAPPDRPDSQPGPDRAASEAGTRAPAPSPYRRRAAEPSWEERVKRATFYIDRVLLDQLDAACREHGLNKSEFVRDAIHHHLQTINRQP